MKNNLSSMILNGAARKAAPFFACALLLSACGQPFQAIFIGSSEPGLSAKTKTAILKMQDDLAAHPQDIKAAFSLANLYLQAVRETADTAYYARVESLLTYTDRMQPGNPETEFLRGRILMGRHDFAGALPLGQRLVAAYPQVQRYYGLLTDAQIETGDYPAAVRTLQAMADLKPDNAVLTRIAYVREIHGDFPGAVTAMRQAARAPSGIPEQDAWILCELGRLLLPTDLTDAKLLYEQALEIEPDYAPALAGLAKIAVFQHELATAKAQATLAFEALGLPEYSALLGDLYFVMGNTEKADYYYALTEAGYDGIAKSGTNVDLERGKFLADHGRNLPLAFELANKVYATRKTIYAADLLSFASLKNNQPQDALKYAKEALRTGSKDPLILTHAALAAEDSGERAKAEQYRRDAAKRPYFSVRPVTK